MQRQDIEVANEGITHDARNPETSSSSGNERAVRVWQFISAALVFALIIVAVLGFRSGDGKSSSSASVASSPSLLDVYYSHFARARYIDLTHAFGPSTNVWPGFGPSQTIAGNAGTAIEGFVELNEEFTFEKHGFVTTQYVLTTDQLGTQLDPPSHWNEFGATMDVIPATVAVRPLVVIDITKQVGENFGYAAQVSDVERWEAEHGRIPEGSVVFFRSGWSLGWEEYKTSGLPYPFPGVGREALIFLHEKRGILFHGHEPLDTDATANLEGEAWLLHNNYAQAEGVNNLHLVPGEWVRVRFRQ
jgi:kynurenine formamidase